MARTGPLTDWVVVRSMNDLMLINQRLKQSGFTTKAQLLAYLNGLTDAQFRSFVTSWFMASYEVAPPIR